MSKDQPNFELKRAADRAAAENDRLFRRENAARDREFRREGAARDRQQRAEARERDRRDRILQEQERRSALMEGRPARVVGERTEKTGPRTKEFQRTLETFLPLLQFGVDLDIVIKLYYLELSSGDFTVGQDEQKIMTELAGHSLTWVEGGDGAHAHNVTTTENSGGGTGIEIDIELTGTVPASGTDGAHYHALAAHTHYANLDDPAATNTGIDWSDFTRTGPSTSGVPTTDDGAHSHSLSGTYTGTFDLSDHAHNIVWPEISDGNHVHSLTLTFSWLDENNDSQTSDYDHAHLVIIPAWSDSSTALTGYDYILTESFVLCFRGGRLIGKYELDDPDRPNELSEEKTLTLNLLSPPAAFIEQ